MSAPGNPWTNTETPDDAPFSERGFGLPPDPKPPAPDSSASMKATDSKDSAGNGQQVSTSARKSGNKTPEKQVADVAENRTNSPDKCQKNPAGGKDTEFVKGPNSKENARKSRNNAGKGRKSVSENDDNELPEKSTSGTTDERMPRIAAIPSKDSPFVMPPRPPSLPDGRLASPRPGSVASRVKAFDDSTPPSPARPARQSVDSTKESAPVSSPAPSPPETASTAVSTPKDSPPSSTSSTVPSVPSSVTSVVSPDRDPIPEQTLSAKASPLSSRRGSIQSETDGVILNQSPTPVQREMSNDEEDHAVNDRSPSPEQTLSREPSDVFSRTESIRSGSDSETSSKQRRSVHWDLPSDDISPVDDELSSAPREAGSPQLELVSHDDLYDASPQVSRPHRTPTIDISGPRSSQESGYTVQLTTHESTQNGHGECDSLNNLCEECSAVLNDMSPSVPNKYLHCPPNVHPVTLKCTIWASVEDARQIASTLSRYLHKTVSRDVRVHAAVRRAASAAHREGRWYDVTSSGIPGPVSRQLPRSVKGAKVHNFLGQAFLWPLSSSSFSSKVLGKEWDRRPRDFRILIDFPMPVEGGGPLERYITSRLPNTSTKPKLKIIDSHCSFHRLMWWARTHPAGSSSSHASSEEPSSRRHRHHSSR